MTGKEKGPFDGLVRANRRIGQRFYRLSIEFSDAGAAAFAKTTPGQFAQLDLSTAALPPTEAIPQDLLDASGRKILLRRPFSFSSITVKENKTLVDIVYCVVGPASLRMTTLPAGNSVNVIGPLGNGFWVPQGKRTVLLVSGGMGTTPLQHLAQVMATEKPEIEVIAFAGAKNKSDLPFERRLDEISQQLGFSLAEFGRYGITSYIATDDGSAGFAGPVTDCLADWLGKNRPSAKNTIIYACGPEAMLKRIAEIAQEYRIDCQVSMERMMACGIGICQSCAVECKVNDSKETVYKLCCKDGPVFDAKEVVFSRQKE